MKILVACEYSGICRDAFIKRGHDAISCDILPTEAPGPHYQGDVKDILYDNWDMVLSFPPCTHLCIAGSPAFSKKRADGRQAAGIEFFMLFTRLSHVPHVAIENPIGIMSNVYREPDQIIQPYWFGHPHRKSTCLWLKNLPALYPTNTVEFETYEYNSKQTKSGKRVYGFGYSKDMLNRKGKTFVPERSKFWPGIADAMADQWTGQLTEQMELFAND